MKKIYIFILVLTICLFSSCGSAEKDVSSSGVSSLPEESGSTSNAESSLPEASESVTNKEELHRREYNAYSEYFDNHVIREYLNNNPIDKVAVQEEAHLGSTAEMRDYYGKYIDIWNIEIKNACEILRGNLSKEAWDNFSKAQSSWEIYTSKDIQTAQQAFIIMSKSDPPPSIASLSTGEKIMEQTRERALELASYCFAITEKYEFVFKG